MDYIRPSTVEDVIEALERFGDGAKLVAGGQSLLAIMKQGILEPDALISLSNIDALRNVELLDDGSLVIGAMVTHSRVMTDLLIQAHAPILAETARRVASVQIRNMGTWGGNLSHGEPGADPPATLIAVGAEVEIAGPNGVRRLPVPDFFIDYLTTDLRPGEVLTKIIVPPQPKHNGAAYIKYTVRDDGDLAIVGVCARAVMNRDSGVIDGLRIGINGASLTPLRGTSAEDIVLGQAPDMALYEQAGFVAAEACSPLDDAEASAEYRLQLVRVLVKRALQQAVDRARGRKQVG